MRPLVRDNCNKKPFVYSLVYLIIAYIRYYFLTPQLSGHCRRQNQKDIVWASSWNAIVMCQPSVGERQSLSAVIDCSWWANYNFGKFLTNQGITFPYWFRKSISPVKQACATGMQIQPFSRGGSNAGREEAEREVGDVFVCFMVKML